MRTSMAPRTQDSGMLVDAVGSRRGREGSTFVDEGRIPACWCCNSAFPRARGLGVRVSAVKGQTHESEIGSKGTTITELTATPEAGTNSINTFCSFDLSHDDITRALNSCPNFGRTVQMDLSIVSGSGDKRRHRKTVTIDDDNFAISKQGCGHEAQHDRKNKSSYL